MRTVPLDTRQHPTTMRRGRLSCDPDARRVTPPCRIEIRSLRRLQEFADREGLPLGLALDRIIQRHVPCATEP